MSEEEGRKRRELKARKVKKNIEVETSEVISICSAPSWSSKKKIEEKEINKNESPPFGPRELRARTIIIR